MLVPAFLQVKNFNDPFMAFTDSSKPWGWLLDMLLIVYEAMVDIINKEFTTAFFSGLSAGVSFTDLVISITHLIKTVHIPHKSFLDRRSTDSLTAKLFYKKIESENVMFKSELIHMKGSSTWVWVFSYHSTKIWQSDDSTARRRAWWSISPWNIITYSATING